MNIFVLCTGRCGSLTLFKACQYIENFSCGHESRAGLHANYRFQFPKNHIEIDNRLSWMLGRLDAEFGDDAIYVHLTRNDFATAQSYNKRWDTDVSIVSAYTAGILMRDSQGMDDCLDYVSTVNDNIRHFLKDKSKVYCISVEKFCEDFTSFWKAIGAKGDLDKALDELQHIHNESKFCDSRAKPPKGGNHSFISRKLYQALLEQREKLVSLEKSAELTGRLLRKQGSLDGIEQQFLDAVRQKNLQAEENAKNKALISALQSDLDQLRFQLESEKLKNSELGSKFKLDIRHLNNLIRKEREKMANLKSSLLYSVGAAFVRGMGASRFPILRLPFACIYSLKGVLEYREAGRAKRLEAPKTNSNDGVIIKKNVASKADGACEKWPKPKPKSTSLAFQAMRVMEEHGLDEAIKFFEAYKSESDNGAYQILLANKAISSDAQWLVHINKYLDDQGILPIALKSPEEGAVSEFQRITSVVPESYYRNDGQKVSIIMPAFNAGKTIAHSIASVLNQTWRNIELIVVDDCSKDNTWEIISDFSRADDRVIALRNKVNVGPYVSKNTALNFASGVFLTGHDADDWAHPQRIERQLKLMLDNPEIKVSIARMLRLRQDRVIDRFAKHSKSSHDGVARTASISCMFDFREFKSKLGHWDSVRFGGDSEMIERAAKIFGEGFFVQNLISMLCLDAEGSLTNHPEHGIDRVRGISPSRVEYREAWMRWHETIDVTAAYLEFPPVSRKYPAPEAALVPLEAIHENLSALKANTAASA